MRHAAGVVVDGDAYGADRSSAMVETARRRSRGMDNVHFEVGTAESLPFRNDMFDVVWTVHAFHHWDDQEAGIAECLRVLAPGGRFLILERESSRSHGLSRTSADDLAGRLLRSGFEEAEVTRHEKELVVTGTAPG